MPKALCLAGMVISILIFTIFLADLIPGVEVFQRASVMIDIIFIVCALALGVMSFTTFREQD